MFIGFDIGNSNTIMGLYNEDSSVPVETWRFITDKAPEQNSFSSILKNYLTEKTALSKIDSMAFASVVPETNLNYHSFAKETFNIEALEISHKSKLSIKLNYDDPSKLGVDRIVNAEAVFNEYKGNQIIIDIGTAATFCVLLDNGTFDGGLIAPGIGINIKALARSASNLPEICFEKPDKLVATNTINAIKSGFFYGWLSMVEGLIEKIESEYKKDFSILLTGGFSQIIGDNINRDNIADPLLTMKGIKYIYNLNKIKS